MVKRKVLLIGWDGADWKVINKLIDQGKMPNIQKLVENGVMGNITTLQPPLSPMLWTSIATGKRPYKHGILGFTEPSPDGSSIRPITNLARRTRAIWNILQLEGLKSNVVGWWPSHPAEPISGVMVSDMFQKINGKFEDKWPMRPRTVHPPALAEKLAKFRIHPGEFSAEHIGPFVPDFGKIDQDQDKRLENIAKTIAECSSVHAAATAVMQLEPWDFMAVYYDSIDHFSHGFMQMHPPKLPWVKQADYDIYNKVVEGGYIYHDMMLGTLVQLAGEETTIIINSDHGFHSDHLRPQSVPVEPAGPAVQHRDHGIILLHGPGIKKDEHIYGATLLDITPTILHLFDLPIGSDMDGAVLINAFEDDTKEIKKIDSWDDVEGQDGCHPATMQLDPREAYESVEQLVELGYIEAPGPNIAETIKSTVDELKYNEARSYMDASLYSNAEAIMQGLVESKPDEFRFSQNLITCYQALQKYDLAEALADKIYEIKMARVPEAKKEVEEFLKERKDLDRNDWPEQDHHLIRKLNNDATFNPAIIHSIKGSILSSKGQWEDAEQEYRKAIKNGMALQIRNRLAVVLINLKKYQEAEKILLDSLKYNPNDARVCIGLCRVCVGYKKYEEAIDYALQAAGLNFQDPIVHYYLALALQKSGKPLKAVEALQIAVRLNPNFSRAYDRLAKIYKNQINDSDLVSLYESKADEARENMEKIKAGDISLSQEPSSKAFTSDMDDLDSVKPKKVVELAETTLVVSGLPRSGTSLMMQMLNSVGIDILSDKKRLADDDNPKGYFEYAPVKNSAKDVSWIKESKGKAVKVIAQILKYLPYAKDNNYRIIFMERDLAEVLNSQSVMISHSDSKKKPIVNSKLYDTFTKQLAATKRLLKTVRVPTLYIQYTECIENPLAVAKKVSEFLDGKFDPKVMASVIDAKLYRQRKK